jgi:hypothetical protein
MLDVATKPKPPPPNLEVKQPKPVPAIEKERPPSLPARPGPPIPDQLTFREAMREIQDAKVPSSEPPIRPSFERPQTAFKVGSTSRRFSLQPEVAHDPTPALARKMSLPPNLDTIEQSIMDPPVPIEKDTILVEALQSSQAADQISSATLPETKKSEITESTLPIKPGNTINKFWKALYLNQSDASQMALSQVLTSSIDQAPKVDVSGTGTALSSRNTLLELPKLDLSLNVEPMMGISHSKLVREPETMTPAYPQESNVDSNTDHSTIRKQNSTTNHLSQATPRVSHLQLENATKSSIPDLKSFIVTPIEPLDEVFSTYSTPTQSFQTAPLETDETRLSMQSVRSVQGPRPLPMDLDQSLSRSMASMHSVSAHAPSISDTSKRPVGPRPLPPDSEQVINQTMNESMQPNQTINRSVMGPRPLPRESEDMMNQSVTKSIHASMQQQGSFDDSMLSMDDSFDLSMIQHSKSSSQLKGPREEPSAWDMELSFNLDENRTSTTNQKFKDLFHQLVKKSKS